MRFFVHKLVLLCCVIMLLSACFNSRTEESPTDSNTNWLKTCEKKSDCKGATVCICGICTTTCHAKNDCAEYGEKTTCVGLKEEKTDKLCNSEDRQHDPFSFCALECETDNNCTSLQEGLSCIDGLCGASMVDELAIQEDAGPDSSIKVDAVMVTDPNRSDSDVTVEVDIDSAIIDSAPDIDSAIIDATDDSSDVVIPLGQPGDPCSKTAPCEEPFACGMSSTCETHHSVSNADGRVERLVGHDQYIYWLDWGEQDDLGNYFLKGKVARAPINGGAQEVIVDQLIEPHDLLVDDTHVYYTAQIEGTYDYQLWRASHSEIGTDAELLGPAGSEQDGYTQDSDRVYIVRTSGQVFVFDKSTGSFEQVTEVSPEKSIDVIGPVGIDEQCLYVCAYYQESFDGTLLCLDKQNWEESVIKYIDECGNIEANENDLVVQDFMTHPMIVLIDKESGETQLLAETQEGYYETRGGNYRVRSYSNEFGTFQLYDQYIYWVSELVLDENDQNWFILRAPLTPGQTELVVEFLTGAEWPKLAVYNNSVFWNDRLNENTIMRLELPES